MWYKILTFELNYRKNRPATYIYFGLYFLMAFLAVSFQSNRIAGIPEQVKENAPIIITILTMQLSLIFALITSAVMGVPVLRDFEHGADSLIFVNPIKKNHYILGRFAGSFIVLILISTGVPLGLMLGEFMPWRDAGNLLPFNFQSYFQPYLILFIPNMFVMGVLFFATGTVSRKIMVVYLQGIFFLVLFMISKSF
ncbi:MAG: hypothetical protein JSV24_09290, partial [Bacteroidales bacterium]